MFNISISPPQTELVIKPSGHFTQAYQVKNNGNQTLYLSTSIKQWLPADSTGTINYFDTSTDQISFSLANADLNLGQNFILKPGQDKQIVLKLVSSKATPDQDYYFTFFISQIDQGGSTSSSLGQIGAHILMSSSTNLTTQPKATINSIKTTPKLKDIFFRPISLSVDLQNQSDNFFKAEGKLIIQKGGKIIKELAINPQNILANSSHYLTCLENDQVIPCSISPPFWPGPYTATLKLESEINYTSFPSTFLVLPYSIFALIIVISAFVLFIKKSKDRPKILNSLRDLR